MGELESQRRGEKKVTRKKQTFNCYCTKSRLRYLTELRSTQSYILTNCLLLPLRILILPLLLLLLLLVILIIVPTISPPKTFTPFFYNMINTYLLRKLLHLWTRQRMLPPQSVVTKNKSSAILFLGHESSTPQDVSRPAAERRSTTFFSKLT